MATMDTATIDRDELVSLGAEYRNLQDELLAFRRKMDKSVLTARECGIPYRQIADDLGYSVAWVQLALARAMRPES